MKTDKELPSDFDWVTARHRCSINQMLEALIVHARTNVETAKAINDQAVIEFSAFGDSFTIMRNWWGQKIGARVIVHGEQLEAQRFTANGNEPVLAAAITLNNAGQCRWLVNGEELDHWQLSRRVLEPILFPPPEVGPVGRRPRT